jgi:CRP-like cAMP-binding protein
VKAVRLLDHDPELGLRVPPSQLAQAQAELVAAVTLFEPGLWEIPAALAPAGGLGCLILDGLLARELVLARSVAAELIGEGDIVHPFAGRHDDGFVHAHAQWHVLTPLLVAVLDERFARRLADWPQVMGALLERSMRRTHRMAIHQALLQLSPVETRLLVLLWHLAERWGRVSPDGIVVRLRLSHEMLGHLVGCRRASVTTALAHVCDSGRITRRSDGTWLLHGVPPGELTQLRWRQRQPPSLDGDHERLGSAVFDRPEPVPD